MTRPQRSRPLIIALALALLAHGLLLYAAWFSGFGLETAPDQIKSLSIAVNWVHEGTQAEPTPDAEIEVEPEPESEPVPEPEPVSPPESRPMAKNVQEPHPEPPADGQQQTAHQAEVEEQADTRLMTLAAQPSRSARAEIESDYLAGLRSAIMLNRQYPRNAQRRRREGTATVGFILNRDGLIRDIRISSSSGDRSLDRAALDAVRELGRYDPIPKSLEREVWPLTVSLEFTLR